MKYRPLLKEGLKNIDIASETINKKKNNWQTQTYKIKVITPIYGGGVNAGEPDKDMPIRASAIRGQLRYWWRFLAMNRPENPLSEEKLFIEERRIWGGMTDNPNDDGSSKLIIRVFDIKGIEEPKPCCVYEKKMRNNKPVLDWNNKPKYAQPKFLSINNTTIPQYAIFPAQGKPPSAKDYNEKTDKPHKLTLPDFLFQLKISAEVNEQNTKNLSIDDWKLVMESIRWWVSFGGIGARTRRGLGSVICTNSTFTPLTIEEVNNYPNCQLLSLSATNAMSAWSKSISLLQQFRQKPGLGRCHGKGNRPGRSYWPEADSIREITDRHSKEEIKIENGIEVVICNDHTPKHPARISFPRAQFGLPIIFKFNNKDEKYGDPKQSELHPVNLERMSSPLILKAMQTPEGINPIALKLPTNFNFRLELKGYQNKPSNLNTEKENKWQQKYWNNWSENWWDSSKSCDVSPITNYQGTDALCAFMNFFASKGE